MPQAYRFFESAIFNPDDLNRARQAFDAAWEAIAGNYGTEATVEAARTRLACIILTVVGRGEVDATRVRDAALQAMKRSEQPLPFPKRPLANGDGRENAADADPGSTH